MRFVRERKTERVPNGGVAADGSPATQVNILEESVETLILGDGTSEFSINRKDFGMQYPGMADDLIRDEVVIKLDIKGSRGRS